MTSASNDSSLSLDLDTNWTFGVGIYQMCGTCRLQFFLFLERMWVTNLHLNNHVCIGNGCVVQHFPKLELFWWEM